MRGVVGAGLEGAGVFDIVCRDGGLSSPLSGGLRQEVGRHMDTSTLGGDIAHIVHSETTRNRLTFLHTQN